jgi:geranylgeranyl reductase family protein
VRYDVAVVGGGPAGSSCARALTRGGARVVVLDRAAFPRDKVCAGWITPPVLGALDIDPAAYAAAGLTIEPIRGFRTGTWKRRTLDTAYDEVVSYAIRRCEFDDYLLSRSGADLRTRTGLASLERTPSGWRLNGTIDARVVVGAGGHFCPVAKYMGRRHRRRGLVAAREIELRVQPARGEGDRDPELYFCEDLEGYGWCVRKSEYVNVGFGRRAGQRVTEESKAFAAWLCAAGNAPDAVMRAPWKGHAYLLAGSVTTPRVADGALLVGDAAGLAYPESGEGIRPAVESGLLAARVLLEARGTSRVDLQPYEDALRRGEAPVTDRRPSALHRLVARWMLSNATLTRRVVLNRWFLHAT